MSFFALTTILFFASCSKEAIIQPETIAQTDVELANSLLQKTNEFMSLENTPHSNANGINVTVTSQSTEGVGLTVDFTSSHDFTDSNLEATQNIDFTDGSGNTVTLTFGVNSYSGGNGTLQVNFAMGGNDLTGLGIKTTQIIVEDGVMN